MEERTDHMTINISDETVKTIMISLRDSERSLKRRMKSAKSTQQVATLKHQLIQVQNVIDIFKECE